MSTITLRRPAVVKAPAYRYRPSLRWAIQPGPLAEPIGFLVSDEASRLVALPSWLRLGENARLSFAGVWMP